MKQLLIGLAFMIVGISVNSYLNALHHNLYEVRYEACKAKLIAEDNWKTQQQAFDCVKNSLSMKILGTLLFSEGSVLE